VGKQAYNAASLRAVGAVVDGDFRLRSWLVQPSLNTVSRNGTSIQLEPKVMSVLVCLAEHAPEPVSKEKLLQQVWPDTFVGEGVLTRSISELRRVFEDEAKEPRVIQTIAKRGYRLMAPVTPAAGKVVVVPAAAQSAGPGDQRASDRVAIFPLANPGGSPDVEYLLSGIPGSIIRGLSPLPGLTVVAGGIVPSNGNQEGNVQAFGRKFSVGTALLGRLLERRTKLCLQVDLVDTKTGKELWADQFDRDFAELFLVEDAVVNEVSKQLRLNLGKEDARLRKRYTENVEAYQLYLRGRYWCESRTAEGFKKGIEYLKNAIQVDPRYALAYAELATVLYLPGYYGMVRPQESFPNARSAAETALELDGDLAEAREALATLNLFDWRWEDAEREYKLCLEINPNHTLSHYHYAFCLCELGRYREAITEAKEAQLRDPLSGPTNAGLAWTYWAAGQYEKALQQALIATELAPHSMFARVTAGVAYEQNGMYHDSIAEFQEGIDRHGGSMFLGFQGHAFACSGDEASARNNVRKLQNLSKEQYVAPSHLAMTFAGLEEKDLAIQSLQRAYENRDSFLVFTRMLPQFDNLRSDSRFQDLLQRMNFPS
jgi:DNA-binding winged helix-turn-helix (wHTH) protein/tetratricopeptide (TPR) repeat protein